MFKLVILLFTVVVAGVAVAEPGHTAANRVAAVPVAAPVAAFTAPVVAAFRAPYTYAATYSAPYATAYTASYASTFPVPYAAAYAAPLGSTSHSHRVDVYNKFNAVLPPPAKLLASAPAAAYFASPYIAANIVAAPARIVTPAIGPAPRLIAPAAALY